MKSVILPIEIDEGIFLTGASIKNGLPTLEFTVKKGCDVSKAEDFTRRFYKIFTENYKEAIIRQVLGQQEA